MTRAQHLQWCKDRALTELAAGNASGGVASMISDLTKHSETAASADPMLSMIGMMEISNGPSAVRRWIEGFN